MKLVIDIDEKMYEDCKTRNTSHYSLYNFSSMIANGTLLPKGHGRIIDESKIEVCEWVDVLEEDYPKASTDAPTIIEEDKGE